MSDANRISHEDEMHRGHAWKRPVRCATIEEILINTALVEGEEIDRVVLAIGDRVLVKDQASDALWENGIYVVTDGDPIRAFDLDADNEIHGATVAVVQGWFNAGKMFRCTNDDTYPLINASDLIWEEMGACCDGLNPPDVGFEATAVSLTAVQNPVVQFAAEQGPSDLYKATLDDPAIEGNTLVAVIYRRNSGEPAAPASGGFTQIATAETTIGFTRYVALWYHVVTDHEEDFTLGGDGLTYQAGDSADRIVLVEIDGAYASTFVEQNSVAATTDDNTGGSITPSAGDNYILIGASSSGGNSGGISPDAESTELHDHYPGSFDPYEWLAYRIVEGASGSYIVGGTQTNSVNYCGVTAAFTIASLQTWTVPEPNTVDDDDLTYEEIDGDEVLRLDIGGQFRIVRSRMLIGSQNTGSKTYELYGATLADYSDAVLLDSVTYNAAGSYIGNELEFEWSTTTNRRFFQIDGTSETRRIYSVQFYTPDSSLGQDHSHTDLEPYLPASTNTPNVGDVWTWGGAEWAPQENVRKITANGSNAIQGPFVNFAAGSNAALSFASNTVTIHSTAAGGGSALTVTEEDGSPIDTAVTKLIFPNGSVTENVDHEMTIRDVPRAFIGCSVQGNSTALTTAQYNTLAFNVADVWDTDGFHDPSSNNTRLTIPAGMGGKYLLTTNVMWPNTTNANSQTRVTYRVNGGSEWNPLHRDATTGLGTGVQEWVNTAWIIDLNGGDYVEVRVWVTNATSPQTTTAYFAQLTKLDSGKVGQGIGVRATNTAGTSIANNTATPVPFATEDFDTDAFHDNVTNNTRLTVPAGLGGKYIAVGMFTPSATNVNDTYAVIRKNGTTDYAYTGRTGGTTAGQTGHNPTGIIDLVAGDYIELIVFQVSGAANNLMTNAGYNTLSLMRLDSGAGMGVWTAFTPTWTSSGSAPTLGNATIQGRYKLLDSHTLMLDIRFVFGSTSAAGTGTYSFTGLPFSIVSGRDQLLSGYVVDSGTAYFVASARLASGGSVVTDVIVADATGSRVWSGTNPMTIATSDEVRLQGVVEI